MAKGIQDVLIGGLLLVMALLAAAAVVCALGAGVMSSALVLFGGEAYRDLRTLWAPGFVAFLVVLAFNVWLLRRRPEIYGRSDVVGIVGLQLVTYSGYSGFLVTRLFENQIMWLFFGVALLAGTVAGQLMMHVSCLNRHEPEDG